MSIYVCVIVFVYVSINVHICMSICIYNEVMCVGVVCARTVYKRSGRREREKKKDTERQRDRDRKTKRQKEKKEKTVSEEERHIPHNSSSTKGAMALHVPEESPYVLKVT